MTREDGGPAFPCSNEQFTHGNPQTGDAWAGLSLRDYFAGQALVSQLGHPRDPQDGPLTPDDFAFMAYAVADAMIVARVSPPANSE